VIYECFLFIQIVQRLIILFYIAFPCHVNSHLTRQKQKQNMIELNLYAVLVNVRGNITRMRRGDFCIVALCFEKIMFCQVYITNPLARQTNDSEGCRLRRFCRLKAIKLVTFWGGFRQKIFKLSLINHNNEVINNLETSTLKLNPWNLQIHLKTNVIKFDTVTKANTKTKLYCIGFWIIHLFNVLSASCLTSSFNEKLSFLFALLTWKLFSGRIC